MKLCHQKIKDPNRSFYFVLNHDAINWFILYSAVYPKILSGTDRYINGIGGKEHGMDQKYFRKAS